MSQALTIAGLYFRDLIRRPGIWMIVAVGVLVVLASRWLALWALGEELQLFHEFATSTITMCGAMLAAFGAVPLKKRLNVLAAERVLLTRSMHEFSFALGKALGLLIAISLSMLLWVGAYVLALWLFWTQERGIFTYSHFTNFAEQTKALTLPVLSIWFLSFPLCALAVLASARGSLMLTLVSVLAFLALGSTLADWAASEESSWFARAISLLLPDMRFGLARDSFVVVGGHSRWLLGVVLQSLGYGIAILLLAGLKKRELEHA